MKTTATTVFLWWWCLWWCSVIGGGGGVVVETSASPTERKGGRQQGTLPMISEENSQLILRKKLRKTAESFERDLKIQLNGVETEIYAEFFSILQALGNTQENMTQEIGEKLRRERVEVLRKMDKVATYSAIVVENLYRDLKKLLNELGIWQEEDPIDTSVLYSHQQESLEIMHNSDSSSSSSFSSFSDEAYRSKRHMIDWNFDSYSDSSSSDETYGNKRHMTNWDFNKRAQNLAKYEPFKEDELEEILASFAYMNSFTGSQDELDTTLLDWTTAYPTGIPESPQSETGTPPKDCLDLLKSGMAHDGVYTIYPKGLGVQVWCDMSSLGGGWTVVASRSARQQQVDFSRPLLHYQFGFGDPETQHWLGLDHIHALTHNTNSTLRVVFQHHALAAPLHATYRAFSVGRREEGYRLTAESYDPSSTAADALTPHSGATFMCPDPRYTDNSCVEEVGTGWWFLEPPLCYLALPTGHLPSPEPFRGVRGSLAWLGLQYSPETLLLMIRSEGLSA